jgi:hypothetical protein
MREMGITCCSAVLSLQILYFVNTRATCAEMERRIEWKAISEAVKEQMEKTH